MVSKIFVDCDSVNRKVIIFLLAFTKTNKKIKLCLVVNKLLEYLSDFNNLLTTNVVYHVDSFILENSDTNSLVITRDIALANIILKNNIMVLNDEGFIFNKDNIKYLIFKRSINLSLHSLKIKKKHSHCRNKSSKYKFFIQSFYTLFPR